MGRLFGFKTTKFLGDNGNFDVHPISKIIKITKTGARFIANFSTIKEEE